MLFVFNGSLWPTFIVGGLLIGIVGLVSTKASSRSSNEVVKARWKVSVVTMIICVFVYICAAYFVSKRDVSGLSTAALVIIGTIMIPYYFGATQLLTRMLIADNK